MREVMVLGEAARSTITAGSSLDVDPGDLQTWKGKTQPQVLETALAVVLPFGIVVA